MTFPCKHLKFSSHAIQRMFDRDISTEDIRKVLGSGETIADYPDDSPYPSQLVLGFAKSRPLHVVVAFDQGEQACYIVTAYEPDNAIWHDDFRTRRH